MPPDAANGSVLTADTVTRRFGAVLALDRVSIDVGRGECVALVGESGSGKTTLLRCFNRLVEPDEGRILVEGRAAKEQDPIQLRRRVGYVPQEGGLLPHWTTAQNVELVPRLLAMPDAGERARASLDLVGLPPAVFADRRPSQLSGGQRQRAAIARAIAARPSIILLDEPFGALDAITRAELQEMFLVLRSELSLTALLVTHDLVEADRLAVRIAVLRGGRIEQVATPGTLRRSAATDYVRQLLLRARILPA